MAGRASSVKMGHEGGGLLVSPDGVAPSRIVGVSASDISPSTIKSRRSFLLAPAHPGIPGKRALKRFCVFSLHRLYGVDVNKGIGFSVIVCMCYVFYLI